MPLHVPHFLLQFYLIHHLTSTCQVLKLKNIQWMGWQSQQRRIAWCKWWSMSLVHCHWFGSGNVTDSQIKSLLIGSSRFTTKKRWNYWPCCYWLQNLFYFVAISYFVCILSMAVLHCLLFPQYLVVVANDFRNTYHGKLKAKCQKSWTKLYRVTQRLV